MALIKNIIGNVVKDLTTKSQSAPDAIGDIWKKCVNKRIALHTKAAYLKRGRLYVHVENSAWLYEVKTHKVTIMKRIKKTSQNKIKTLFLKVGAIHDNRE